MSERPGEHEPSAARNIYAFGVTSFLNDTATEMAYWVLPAFLASLGAGPAQLGLIEGVAESVASFAKLFSGYLTDRIERRKPVVVAGYAVANAVKPLLAVVTAWPQILLIRFTDRLAKGVRGAPRDVMVAESVPKNRLGSAYGLIQSMDSAGAIAGPLAALILMARYGIRSVFWAAAIPGALCVLVALLGIRETRRNGKDSVAVAAEKSDTGKSEKLSASPVANTTGESKSIKFPASFYFVLIAVTLFSLGNSSDMFLVLRAQNVGIRVALAPLLGLVFNITYTLASWPAGWFSDHVSRRLIASVGYVIFAAVYFVFGRAPSTMAIWIAMAVYGFYNALTQPVLKALVVDSVGEQVRGRALGIYFFVTSLATLGASLITGGLWKYFGPGIPFYFSATLALIAAAVLQGARSSADFRRS
ncbi:MAG TPA: MFS transporter [Candidatus Sulfotelmatobacter sp.]|jgi:MFS family permease|nr:MFS transporter [Candidatus Sulfotelmatobacter sp.]